MLLTPGERLIARDQSRQAEAAPGVIDSEENGFLYMGVEGAPRSYYLVFLVPGAGNLILYHAFYFLLVWRTSLQCQAALRTRAEHGALSQSSN